jgi:hypothetical protein
MPWSKVLLAVVCAVLLMCAPAWSEIGPDAAAVAAQRMNGGRVLLVERTGSGSDAPWRVKLVTAQGGVVVVLIDAASGQAL